MKVSPEVLNFIAVVFTVDTQTGDSLSRGWMPRAGNDLEALQIHLCFCRSNLHPRRTARSGSTLVSAVSNIYLSQQTGERERDAAGDCRQSYQLDTRSLPAESCFVKRI